MEQFYYEDAFDQTNEGTNLTINNLNANCITSLNDNFNLDSDGNLTVNSIEVTGQGNNNIAIDYKSILNLVYPVGSIYISVNEVNPTSLFGGSWISFGKGKTLIGVDSEQIEFNTVEKIGGSKTHTLTVNEMPVHNHTQSSHTHNFTGTSASSGSHRHNTQGHWLVPSNSTGNVRCLSYEYISTDPSRSDNPIRNDGAHTHTVTGTITSSTPNINSAGSSETHNNLQPYITVYMWKRVS